MSKRRQPGEIVKSIPGNAFSPSKVPEFVRLTDERDGSLHYVDYGYCDDPDCQEWGNVQIVGGLHHGEWMFHLEECYMEDTTPDERRSLQAHIQDLMQIRQRQTQQAQLTLDTASA